MNIPSVSELDMRLPAGFRAVGNAQAVTEFSMPLLEEAGDDIELLNRAVALGQLFWNHSLSIRRGEDQTEAEGEVIEMLVRAGYPGTQDELRGFIRKQVERFNLMFPEDMQEIAGPMHMIMRNINPVEVKAYDYSQAKFSTAVVPPNADDEMFLRNLVELDEHVRKKSAYEKYEEIFFDVIEYAPERFEKWLKDKNAPGHMMALAECLEVFITFVYAYEPAGTLSGLSQIELNEFFNDHLLRKMTAKPNEYPEWPAAMKFFYQFLKEKEYMENSGAIIEAIDKIETHFIDVLKKRFG